MAFIFLTMPFNFFSSSSRTAMASLTRLSDGVGVSERSTVTRAIGRMASPMGAMGRELLGKKTVSKLEDGDVGVWGAR